MSQQEFFQQPERRSGQDQNAETASTYYRRSDNAPKEEHPSTFEDAVPPYAYPAQDTRRSSSQSAQEEQARQRSADGRYGATSEHGYRRPYTQYQQPSYRGAWRMRRFQQRWQNVLVRWAIIILLIFVLLHVLPFLVSVLLVILGVLAVALLLPIFLILGVIATFAVITLFTLKMLGIPIRWSWLRSRLFGR